MTVNVARDGTIRLVDDCRAEDADLLLQRLIEHPHASIDWGSCRFAHTSVIQVLLAWGGIPVGSPPAEFLKIMIKPALGRARGKIQPSRGIEEMRNS